MQAIALRARLSCRHAFGAKELAKLQERSPTAYEHDDELKTLSEH